MDLWFQGQVPFDFVGRHRRKHIQAQEENRNQPRQTEPKAAGRKEANNKKEVSAEKPRGNLYFAPRLSPPSNTHVEFRAPKRLNWVSKGRKEVVKPAYPPPSNQKGRHCATSNPAPPPSPLPSHSPRPRAQVAMTTGLEGGVVEGEGEGRGGRGNT